MIGNGVNMMQDTLNIRSIVTLLLKRVYWIIAATILGLVSLFCISKFVMTPMYTASVLVYVDGQEDNTQVNKTQLDLNRSMVSTYVVLLESRGFMQEVASDLSKPLSMGEVKSYVSMGAVNNTEILEIKAVTPDPTLSAEICNTFADKAPDMIEQHIKGGDASIISRASTPTSPSSPNIALYTLLGAFLGFAVACGLILLVSFLDNTVKGQDDISEKFGVPVLGEIPELSPEPNGGTRYVAG